MNSVIREHLAAFLPLFFASLWLTLTTILSWLSGWFRLAAAFPNQTGAPSLRLRGQSGSMGIGVGMRGILTVSVCPTGLRVGMMRVFGPFCPNFFVPWKDITVIRKTFLFQSRATLQFGRPAIGCLTISAHIANILAHAAMAHWPEAGPFPEEQHRDLFRRLITQWAVMTCAAALFFTLVPLAVAPATGRPPIVVAILFPAMVFGVNTIINYARERN